jgi:hypothetical protein
MDSMEKMYAWLQSKQNTHGPIVTWMASIAFLVTAALGLAVLFALFGFSMWVSPYLAAAESVALVAFLIYKQY